MITYTINFDHGLSITKRNTACFAGFRDFNNQLEYYYGFRYNPDKCEIQSICYPFKYDANVQSYYFIEYLFTKYSIFIQEKSAREIFESGAVTIKGSCPTNWAFIILSFFRLMDETPYKISLFYSLKDNKYKDLSFLICCLIDTRKYVNYDSNHIPVRLMGIEKLYEFVNPPKKYEGISLQKDPNYSNLTTTVGGIGEPDVLLKCVKDNEGDINLMYASLEKIYEEYSSIMAEKLRETLLEGEKGCEDNLLCERDWESIIFA